MATRCSAPVAAPHLVVHLDACVPPIKVDFGELFLGLEACGKVLSFRSMEGALLEAILKAAGMQVWEAVSHAARPEAPPRRLAPRSQVPAV